MIHGAVQLVLIILVAVEVSAVKAGTVTATAAVVQVIAVALFYIVEVVMAVDHHTITDIIIDEEDLIVTAQQVQHYLE